MGMCNKIGGRWVKFLS